MGITVFQKHFYETGRINFTVYTDSIYVHPNYHRTFVRNDIALIKTTYQYKFSEYIQPIKLPSTCDSNENIDVIVMGFGITKNHSPGISARLHYAYLRTKTRWQCLGTFLFLGFRRSVLCAKCPKKANHPKFQATCQGDSGGPVVFDCF